MKLYEDSNPDVSPLAVNVNTEFNESSGSTNQDVFILPSATPSKSFTLPSTTNHGS